jgi:hypothetical protein
MIFMAIGRGGESTFPEVWLFRGGRWVPAWYHYNVPRLALALAPPEMQLNV